MSPCIRFVIFNWRKALIKVKLSNFDFTEKVVGENKNSSAEFENSFFSTRHFLENCVKSVQIQSYFWSVFSCIRTEYRKIWSKNKSVFGHFSRSAIFLGLIVSSVLYLNILLTFGLTKHVGNWKKYTVFPVHFS